MTDTTPPPGSDAAIDAGCRCPVLDNAHGRGYRVDSLTGEVLYVRNMNCPLHAPPTVKVEGVPV